ncbi:MAG: hypothetical protein ACK4ZJ_17225, partial [Allorhizobium sp.]
MVVCSIDVAAARRAITRNTVGIYASAPTFPHGVVDPIEELGQLAQERRLLLHVDNCFGGFLLSFLQQQRLFNKRFDFLAPGACAARPPLPALPALTRAAAQACPPSL